MEEAGGSKQEQKSSKPEQGSSKPKQGSSKLKQGSSKPKQGSSMQEPGSMQKPGEKEKQTLEEELSNTILHLLYKRIESTNRLRNLESKILESKKEQARDVKVLPSTDANRVAIPHPTMEPLPENMQVTEENKENLPSRIQQLSEQQEHVKKCQE